jgi:hypothetical protein
MSTNGSPPANTDTNTTPSSSSGPVWLATTIAILAVVGYTAFIYVLYQQVGTAEPGWSRKVLLFTGVEAVAFAAAGWLFGREVNRSAVEAAKAATSQAQGNAAAAGTERGRGELLASALRNAAGDSTASTELRATTAARSQLGSLVAMANEFYPPA